MGAWGTGISSNDTYADIYEQFIDLYNEGRSVAEITAKLISENQETIEIEEDSANFWFALANGQWECKGLVEDILSKVEQIIQSGDDISVWRELGASPADLKVRAKVLDKFLTKLRTERKAPRKRKKKKYYDSLFKKGDCLTYKMDNGNYGGAFVLTDEQQTESGTNYIAITTIDRPDRPTLADFKNAEVYVQWAEEISFKGTELHTQWLDQPQIGGFCALSNKNEKFDIEVIGQLPVYKDYIVRRIVGFGWRALQIKIPCRNEYERLNGKPRKQLKLSEWTKKRWRFRFLHREQN